jgi:hypothetical protein
MSNRNQTLNVLNTVIAEVSLADVIGEEKRLVKLANLI